MKNYKRIFTLSLATVVLTGITPLFAQDSTTTPPPPHPGAHGHDRSAWQKRGNALKTLTKDEREELRTVIGKTKDDSKVIAARNDLKEAAKAEGQAVKAAVVKADPNAQAIFDSMGKGKDRGNLTSEQRDELKTDFEKAKDDSSVKTAREQLRKAHEAYVSTWRAAAVAADSKIQTVLDKLPKNWAPGERPMRGPGGRNGQRGHHHKGAETSGTQTTGSASN